MPRGSPESLVRGFSVARAGVAAEGSAEVASARRTGCVIGALWALLLNAGRGFEAGREADGARKSRYSCDVAAVRLYALAAL